MNIREAQEQIKNAVMVYLEKDEDGYYALPVEKQRPIFMMGAPGIGKTAIMAQIAEELGIALVSYSMTHHTRQSALGLPYIIKKIYQGREVSVSEYTMSEILAAVYNVIEESGFREGILFLDEINCVSETLVPAMLQFLQYKTFGQHQVPEGWIVVTAGNPAQYNDSVREFDIATWDRVKRIDVDPDFGVWKDYGYKIGMHSAILTYLELKKEHFYRIETTVDGKQFVTARGWEDLSRMMTVCEEKNIPVDERLISQYVQNTRVAKDFAIYYQLFQKYQSDYQIDKILAGRPTEKILQRTSQAGFDERIALLGMVMDALMEEAKEVLLEQAVVFRMAEILKSVKTAAFESQEQTAGLPSQNNAEDLKNQGRLDVSLKVQMGKVEEEKVKRKKAGILSVRQRKIFDRILQILEEYRKEVWIYDGGEDFSIIKKRFSKMAEGFQESAKSMQKKLDHVFEFCEMAFRGGQEILILVTELTANNDCAAFISQYGCEKYFQYNKEFMFYKRQQELSSRIEALGLDDYE